MVLWGRSVGGCQQVPRKVPPRFHQGSAKVPPKFSKFRGVFGSLGQISLGLPKGSPEGSAKVPTTVHHGSTKALQVSWCLWLSGAGPSWAAQRFPRFHQGSTKVSRRFRTKSFVISLVFWGASLWFPKGFCGGFPHHFFTFASQFLQLFFVFFPNRV